MKDLLWLIPLFPLAGFVVNGLLYLFSHRTLASGSADDGNEIHPTEARAAAAPHASAPSAHVDQHPRVPFKSVHAILSPLMVALSCVVSFGAILDWVRSEGLSHPHVVTLASWIPQGINSLRLGGRAN